MLQTTESMKTKIFLLLILITLFQSVNAQQFGVQGGLNISKTSGEDFWYNSTSSLPSIHFGLVVEFSLTKKFFFDTGLLYSVKGFKQNPIPLNSNYANNSNGYGSGYNDYPYNVQTTSYSTGYLEVPANLTFKLPITSKLTLCFHTGPTFSYGLYIKSRGSKSSAYDYTIHNLDSKQKYDFGLNLGSGIEFGNINIGVNYNQGLKNISYNSVVKNKNRVFQISFVYMFGKKKLRNNNEAVTI